MLFGGVSKLDREETSSVQSLALIKYNTTATNSWFCQKKSADIFFSNVQVYVWPVNNRKKKVTPKSQYVCAYLRVGGGILLARGTPLVPIKEAGRGRELRGAVGWLALALRGCGTKLLLGFKGWGSATQLGMECRLTEVDRGVEAGPCCTVGLT